MTVIIPIRVISPTEHTHHAPAFDEQRSTAITVAGRSLQGDGVGVAKGVSRTVRFVEIALEVDNPP